MQFKRVVGGSARPGLKPSLKAESDRIFLEGATSRYPEHALDSPRWSGGFRSYRYCRRPLSWTRLWTCGVIYVTYVNGVNFSSILVVLKGVAKQHPNRSEIAEKLNPNGSQKLPKWNFKPSKTEPIWGQEGARTAKKLKKHMDAIKKWVGVHSVALFYSKKWSTWAQLRFQNWAKTDKKSMRKSSQKMMPFKIDFWRILIDFSKKTEGKLPSKSDPTSM